jgi:rhodanese-related sulfurtransferase
MSVRWIDVREYPEYAAAYIEGSQLIPLGTLAAASSTWNRSRPIIIVCRTGRRAEQARLQLVAQGFESLTVLEGGIEAWRDQGHPVLSIERRPWSLERQVRIVAGSLVLITLALAFFVSRYYVIGTALIGAGLVFAGVSDICMMASVLGRMPWNRQPAQQQCCESRVQQLEPPSTP